METQSQKAESKKPKLQNSLLKKLDPDTARLLAQLKERANKKILGRKVRESEILAVAVRQVTTAHLRELQESSLSEHDRLKMAHDDYQKTHGKISMDQFIGKLIRGELQQKKSPTEPEGQKTHLHETEGK